MSDVTLFHSALGLILFLGFSGRVTRALIRHEPMTRGRVGFAALLMGVLYGGFLLASIDKISYAAASLSAVGGILAWALLEISLSSATGNATARTPDERAATARG